MKIDLTIRRGKLEEHLKIEMPTGWAQVKFHEFVKLIGCTDIIKIVALFTGLDQELIREAKIHNLEQITACLSFLNKQPIYTVPNTILGYKIVENLDFESYAQYSDLQDILKGFKKDDQNHNFTLFPLIVSTYAVDPYDFKEAERIKDQFNNAPCTEVLAVANFTLVKLDALNRGIIPTHPPEDTLLNRCKLGLRRWLINLETTIRFYLWKRSLPSSERNYLNGR